MITALSLGISMLVPLAAGFGIFTLLSARRGYSVKDVLRFARASLKESTVVAAVMLIIGALTGSWRQSGTIAYFVTLGVSLIPPRLFLFACFLLAALMGLALGTSVGVSATAGVILISIARAGGVNLPLAAGAILSGVYFGDRSSPAASSASLVAMLTHTDLRANLRAMMKSTLLPLGLCAAAYLALSFFFPMERLDTAAVEGMKQEFTLSWVCLIPAALIIALPFCGVNVKLSMGISLLASAVNALTLQGAAPRECLRAMLLGYVPRLPELSGMLSGGGVLSMLELAGILILSSSYGKIFMGTGILEPVTRRLRELAGRIGRFETMIPLGLVSAALFCNQTIAAILQNSLSVELYSEEEKREKMLDMENSVIPLACVVPWSLACSIPLGMLDMGWRCIPFTFYLWLLPLHWLFRRRRERKGLRQSAKT